MKKKLNIRTCIGIILLFFGMLAFVPSARSQQIFDIKDRQPFDSQIGVMNRAPGVNPNLPPPKEEDKVGGAPVNDTYWLLPLLAVGYGLFIRQRKQAKEAKNEKG